MIWATTVVDGGIYRLNAQNDQFELFDSSLCDLNDFKEDSFHQLWAGTSNDLVKIDTQKKQHVYYTIGKPVRGIFEDRNRNFWLGTEGGGLILFDNTLWSGRVLEVNPESADTRAIQALNLALRDDPRIDLSLLPLGDGLSLCRKR